MSNKKTIKRVIVGIALLLIKPLIVPIIIISILLTVASYITDILYISFNNKDKIDLKEELEYYNAEYEENKFKKFFDSVWVFIEGIFTDEADWPVKRRVSY